MQRTIDYILSILTRDFFPAFEIMFLSCCKANSRLSFQFFFFFFEFFLFVLIFVRSLKSLDSSNREKNRIFINLLKKCGIEIDPLCQSIKLFFSSWLNEVEIQKRREKKIVVKKSQSRETCNVNSYILELLFTSLRVQSRKRFFVLFLVRISLK